MSNPKGRYRQPKGNAETEFKRHRSREWHIQFALPWEVCVDGLLIARFRNEGDAYGFAKARYPGQYEISNMQKEKDND